MPLLIPLDLSGLDPRVADALDDIVAPLQVWAGKVDGINAAERLNELTTGVASLPTVPTGFGGLWYTNTPPTGYLICDGSAVSRTTYANLFALLGSTYGAGDGSTTFNLPNLQRRIPLGKAASGSASTLAGTGGSFDHTHTGPSHTHTGPSHSHSISTQASHTHSISGSTASESAHTHAFSGTTGVGDNHSATDLEQVDDNNDGVQSGVMHGNWTNHDHAFSGTTAAGSAHSHAVGTLAVDSGGSHDHGGSTGSSGTGTTGAGGTENTGSANPPYLVVNYIVKT